MGLKGRGFTVTGAFDVDSAELALNEDHPAVVVVESALGNSAEFRRMAAAATKTVVVVLGGAEDVDALASRIRPFVEQAGRVTPRVAAPWERPAPVTATMAASLLHARASLDAGALAAEVSTGSGPTVLVVDDDPTFRTILCERLGAEGFRVYAAVNATNALKFLRSWPGIDVVISDLSMPHMDGFELKDELNRWSDVYLPFIVVTALAIGESEATRELGETARHLGAFALLAKPIDDWDRFVETVRSAIAAKA